MFRGTLGGESLLWALLSQFIFIFQQVEAKNFPVTGNNFLSSSYEDPSIRKDLALM